MVRFSGLDTVAWEGRKKEKKKGERINIGMS